jgi:hypothetical protein
MLGVLAIGVGLSFSDVTKVQGRTISFLSGVSLLAVGASAFYAKQRDPFDAPSRSLDGVELVIEPEGLERFELPQPQSQAYTQPQPEAYAELPEIEMPSFEEIFQAAPPTLVAIPRQQHQPQPKAFEDGIPQHIRDFAS